jgi:hypothetical protein
MALWQVCDTLPHSTRAQLRELSGASGTGTFAVRQFPGVIRWRDFPEESQPLPVDNVNWLIRQVIAGRR